ncbi:MAG: DsbA family protein [Janthinobacterium lividum]
MVLARFASLCLLASVFTPFSCHAQQPASGSSITATAPITPSGTPLSPELARRIEVMLRQKANLPPESTVTVGGRSPSEFPGFDSVSVVVTSEGRNSRPIAFLLSRDNKTMAQITKFDISPDPKALVSGAGRPARGGGANAPVQIVGFDDLECPFCSRLHTEIFPALTARYGDKVRFVYKDFPIEQHPWATRAAVDVNCLAAQSAPAYWTAVDYIHAHGNEFGADPKDAKADKTLPRAVEQLDSVTREQGQFRKLDMPQLNACLTKQDVVAVNASRELGESLGVGSTPTLFINGDKIDGAVSLEFLYGIIDQALRVANVEPPPPFVAPKPALPPTGAATPSASPGTR